MQISTHSPFPFHQLCTLSDFYPLRTGAMLLPRQLTSRLCSPAKPWVKSVTGKVTDHAGVSARFVWVDTRKRVATPLTNITCDGAVLWDKGGTDSAQIVGE